MNFLWFVTILNCYFHKFLILPYMSYPRSTYHIRKSAIIKLLSGHDHSWSISMLMLPNFFKNDIRHFLQFDHLILYTSILRRLLIYGIIWSDIYTHNIEFFKIHYFFILNFWLPYSIMYRCHPYHFARKLLCTMHNFFCNIIYSFFITYFRVVFQRNFKISHYFPFPC